MIFYTFHPADDGWTGTATRSGSNYSSSVSGSFDYITNSTNPNGAPYAYAYKQVVLPNVGGVKRFKGSFSLSRLPDTVVNEYGFFLGDYADILAIAYHDTLDVEYNYNWNTVLYVMSDGALCFYPQSEHSVNHISAGVTYDLEVVIRDCFGVPNWQILIDGDLWLETDAEYDPDNSDLPYIQFIEGFSVGSWVYYNPPANVTLHIGANSDGEHVWTIENCGTCGRWTMMNP